MNAVPLNGQATQPVSPAHQMPADNGQTLPAVVLVGPDAAAALPICTPRLLQISEQAVALACLYGRGALIRTLAGTSWRFQWRCITGLMTGAELHVRIGDVRAVLGVEDLSAFGSAIDIARPEIPAALHAAILNGLDCDSWRELEALTQCQVEVLNVQLDCALQITPECLGFTVGREPNGPVTRGFLRFVDSDPQRNLQVQRVMSEASLREMPRAPLPNHLRVRWAAVAGSTRLPAAEVRELEEHDVILIDDTKLGASALVCWLGVGPTRRYSGRVMLRSGGQLQMVQFGTRGEVNMSADADTVLPEEAGFDEIPVCLRFELAQWSASLAEVGSLAAGSVVDFGRRIDEHSVSVWVDQRCIGKGQLVSIGDRLGVRLLSVFCGDSRAVPKYSAADGVEQPGP
jgi:type III secretion system YscQ/HrcQ family protein